MLNLIDLFFYTLSSYSVGISFYIIRIIIPFCYKINVGYMKLDCFNCLKTIAIYVPVMTNKTTTFFNLAILYSFSKL